MQMAVVRSTTPGSTGNQSYTVSGFGTPTAAIIVACSATSDDTTAAHSIRCYGITDGTREYSMHQKAIDNQGTSYSRGDLSASNILQMGSKAANTNLDIQASFNAWVTDGIQLNFSTANYQAGIIVVLIKCTNAYAGKKNVPSNILYDITDPGFRPQNLFGFLMPYYNDTNTPASSNWCSVGFAHEDGAGNITQACMHQFMQNGQATTSNQTRVYDDAFIGQAPWADQPCAVSAFDSNGFSITMDQAEANTALYYLALADNDTDEGDVKDIQAPGSTGDQAYTGFGTKPKYVLLLTSESATKNANENDSDTNCMFGFAVLGSDNDNDSFITTFDEDGVSTSETATRMGAGVKVFDKTGISGYDHVATLKSKDSDGFTLNFTTAAQSAYWIALAMGPAPDRTPDLMSFVMGMA